MENHKNGFAKIDMHFFRRYAGTRIADTFTQLAENPGVPISTMIQCCANSTRYYVHSESVRYV